MVICFPAALVVSGSAIVVRFARSAGEERLQLKWFAAAAVLVVATFIALILTNSNSVVVAILNNLALLCLDVAIAIAVLKYRLYEIDRIISRTLAYTIVTGLLVGLYAGLVLLATRVLSFSSPVGRPPRRWSRRRCSARFGGGCSGSWTAGSTGPAMTPTRW